MALVFACEVPDGLWFDVEQDVWIGPSPDGTVRMGMTDPAQTRAGRILQVRVRQGKTVRVGKSMATVESGKWVGPVPAPLAGTIVQANPDVLADPNLINRDPYGAGWLLAFLPEAPPGAWAELGLKFGEAAVAAYQAKLAAEKLTCLRCAPAPE
ncbi:MAG: glycine cleavage system protein H [Thermaerobacter sp.]|nr:glycine cleavage system protein H [Thermaerobacter sp.]